MIKNAKSSYLASICAVLVLAAFGGQDVQAESTSVYTTSEAVGSQTARVEIRAQLLPHQYTTLAAEIGAKVNQVAVSEGGSFKKGDILIAFECSMQEAMLRRAKAERASAEALYRANERLAEFNSIGLVELEQSRAALAKFDAEVGAQEVLQSKCQITAPFNGRLAEQFVREQQFVQPGEPLVDILDDSVLELAFLVPSRWLEWVKLGDRFDVVIDETGKSYAAKFTRIGARVDPVSQSIKVVAAIDGQYPELISGMSGRVMLQPPSVN